MAHCSHVNNHGRWRRWLPHNSCMSLHVPSLPEGPFMRLTGERVELVASAFVEPAAVADYYRRNEAHFSRWDPPSPPGFASAAVQAERLQMAAVAFGMGTGFRYWLVEPHAPQRVVGSVHFSNVARGPFQSASLGYSVDQSLEGRGVMAEALGLGLQEMFSARGRLHRIEAGIRPENERSLALIRRMGFTLIGLAPQYLMIDGQWRDHLLWQRVHAGWMPPEAAG